MGHMFVTLLEERMPAVEAYDTMAPFYDRFTAHHDYELGGAASPARLRARPRRTRALDAGCGTGKSFMPLLARGFEVTGCDQSPAMLEVAAARAGSRVELRCADLRRLDRLGEFDLITCLDDVANYLTEPGDLTSALRGLGPEPAPRRRARLRREHARLPTGPSSARRSRSRRPGS